MDDNAETTILEEGNVKITNFRAIIGSETYTIADIRSVDMIVGDIPDTLRFYFNGYIPIIPVMALAPILVLGLALAVLRYIFDIDYLRYFFYLCALWLLLVVFGGFVLPEVLPSIYKVRIETASGESNILKSKDKDHIQRVVGAIMDAIAIKTVRALRRRLQ